jgi:hypothetical protein
MTTRPVLGPRSKSERGRPPDLIRLLETAHAEAQRALDATVDIEGT